MRARDRLLQKKPKKCFGDRYLSKAGICFEALEPRLLLSGSWGAVVDGPGADTQADSHGSLTQGSMVFHADTGITGVGSEDRSLTPGSSRVDLLSLAPAFNTPSNPVPALDASPVSIPAAPVTDATTALSPADNQAVASNSKLHSDSVDAATRRELVFVNDDVDAYEILINGIRESDTDRTIEIVVIDADRDGIQQVSDILAERSDLSAVHVIAHGSEGRINLGNSWLNSAALEENSDAVAGWGNGLTETGDILFYGCNIAADSDGQRLLINIADLTGADVAASDDPTGQASRGGDWDLEYRRGTIETASGFSPQIESTYQHTLATYTVSSVADSGAGSLRQAIIDANANGGTNSIVFNISGTGSHVIAPTSALPEITSPVTIDATTDDSFAANGGRPAIVLEGSSAGFGADGLWLGPGADGSTIRGLVIRDWGGVGILIDAGSDNNTVAGNYIGRFTTSGTDSGGGTEINWEGISIYGANNVIGGTAPADRNIISGNGTYGIAIDGSSASGNQIIGNWIGTDASGSTALGNEWGGISINNAPGNTIGGPTSAHGNVISGNSGAGIEIDGETADGNSVKNNWIGVNTAGSASLPNSSDGITISGGSDNTVIGGAGTGNWIADASDGIEITGASSGTLIQGNRIGTDLAGTADWGTRFAAISIEGGASNSLIGGTGPGEGNILAYSGSDPANPNAISIWGDAGSGHAILGNTIYSSLGRGIDLDPNGVTPNDAGDGDTGPNGMQNFPVLTSAHSNSVGTTIVGSLNSTPSTIYRLEFYANRPGVADASNGEGERYLGTVGVMTNGSGNINFTTTLANVWVNAGDQITATATVDLGSGNFGSTSEFAQNITATSTGVIVVDTVSDSYDSGVASGSVTITTLGTNRGADGRISLREAIYAANNTSNGGTPDRIVFSIDGVGPHTIAVGAGGLPDITGTVIIDGTTDSDYAGTPFVVLDGSGAGLSDGLTLGSGSDGSTIRGLVINNFGDAGIKLEDSGNHIIVGNYIGTNAAGTGNQGNTTYGIEILNSAGNLIGGSTAADRNVIAGNSLDGITIWGAGSTLNVIQGNYIGVDATGDAGLGNGADGIVIGGGANNNTIGGDRTAGEGNVISGQIGASSDGIEIDNVGANNNKIYGNYIGTNFDGTAKIGNARHGVVIYDGVQGTRSRRHQNRPGQYHLRQWGRRRRHRRQRKSHDDE